MARQDPPKLAGSKRRLQDDSVARKRTKMRHKTADALPWKVVKRPVETGLGGDDGILELEEVDDVEVVYEDTEAGRVVTFNVVNSEPVEAVEEDPESQSTVNDDSDASADDVMVPESEPFDCEYIHCISRLLFIESFAAVNLLPNWHSYSLHPQLLRVLHSKAFLSPTPIQAAAIPFALSDRDVVGVAQTGSGKTLAYGLPILHRLLSCARPSKAKRKLGALILAPTRELALQKSKNKAEQPSAPRSPPLVSVAAIVGGMSAQKQRRILDRGVDVLVATPGRLWDIMEDDDDLAKQIKNLQFLVLDEADRMIEAGHFAELENILRLTLRESKADQIEPEAEDDEPVRDGLQTFVFSATLSKDLQRNVKRRSRPKTAGKYNKRNAPASTLDDLLLRLDFRDPEPEIIDLSPQGGVVSTLKESKIECLSADKDAYLYYFLLRYPGRSLVFLSSIDGIRRLMPLTELLNIKAFPLHSQLSSASAQEPRSVNSSSPLIHSREERLITNAPRFKSTPNSVLLATDIAARGLDIPAVDHVIHYQIPRSADAMLMCSPDERRVVRALLGSLGRQESEIAEMSIELNMLDKLKERVQLARQIETTHHKIKKANHDRKWMKETAEAMEIELDSDFMSDSDEDKPANQKRKAKDLKNAGLKAELKRLLAQPLVARGVSTRYITSGSRPIVDDLLAGEFNEAMVGVKQTEAGNDLVVGKKKKPKVKELRDAYAPEIWWFDGHWAFKTQHAVDAISEVIAYILSQTPNVQINDRMGATPELEGEKNKSQDFMPPFRVYKDRAMPKQAPKVFWEHIGTVGTSWGRDKT
ncbi:P-loop containing nucleoside triphosphate hydrolase protein [Mycena galopus ATCC 62051]|nr:P-loop containing nucleoside triphosphate hydrolase protein [Mycena galopus ATCC 62051]